MLTIDGTPTQSTSSQRVFVSPPLPVEGVYYYNLTAVRQVNGVQETVTERIEVAAGRQSEVTMNFEKTAAVAE